MTDEFQVSMDVLKLQMMVDSWRQNSYVSASSVSSYMKAIELANYLNTHLPFKLCIVDKVDGHCFRIHLPSGQLISVSIPPDCNKGLTMEKINTWRIIYETALIKDDNVIYNTKMGLGYSDVCRFWSKEELVEELVRVNSIISKKNKKEAAKNARKKANRLLRLQSKN